MCVCVFGGSSARWWVLFVTSCMNASASQHTNVINVALCMYDHFPGAFCNYCVHGVIHFVHLRICVLQVHPQKLTRAMWAAAEAAGARLVKGTVQKVALGEGSHVAGEWNAGG